VEINLVTEADARAVLAGFADVVNEHRWDDLGRWIHPHVVWEYPQSGERFRGLANVRGQFENYPGLESATAFLEEVVGETKYALTQAYTIIAVDGSGDRGTAIIRSRYPDGSEWHAINFVELRGGLIVHLRSYFAPDFEAPDWRAPYRDAP
jgi:SnoaL-like domain